MKFSNRISKLLQFCFQTKMLQGFWILELIYSASAAVLFIYVFVDLWVFELSKKLFKQKCEGKKFEVKYGIGD